MTREEGKKRQIPKLHHLRSMSVREEDKKRDKRVEPSLLNWTVIKKKKREGIQDRRLLLTPQESMYDYIYICHSSIINARENQYICKRMREVGKPVITKARADSQKHIPLSPIMNYDETSLENESLTESE